MDTRARQGWCGVRGVTTTTSHYAQTVRGGTTKCLETLAFPRVKGWVDGGWGAGSSELATDRLVGTGGVPASWRHVILIANTLECRCFHQQNHHNTSSQVAGFGHFVLHFVNRCQEVVNLCLN